MYACVIIDRLGPLLWVGTAAVCGVPLVRIYIRISHSKVNISNKNAHIKDQNKSRKTNSGSSKGSSSDCGDAGQPFAAFQTKKRIYTIHSRTSIHTVNGGAHADMGELETRDHNSHHDARMFFDWIAREPKQQSAFDMKSKKKALCKSTPGTGNVNNKCMLYDPYRAISLLYVHTRTYRVGQSPIHIYVKNTHT